VWLRFAVVVDCLFGGFFKRKDASKSLPFLLEIVFWKPSVPKRVWQMKGQRKILEQFSCEFWRRKKRKRKRKPSPPFDPLHLFEKEVRTSNVNESSAASCGTGDFRAGRRSHENPWVLQSPLENGTNGSNRGLNPLPFFPHSASKCRSVALSGAQGWL